MPEFTVNATCHTCGSVPIDPGRIRVHLHDGGDRSYFSCACPSCGTLLGGPVRTQVALGLAGRGAVIASVPFALELLERPGQGPAFNSDDVIELHGLLERADWFNLLLEAGLRRRA